ncbi:MAG: hypothetical protein ACOYOJ_20365 [Alsobacter sp.]
MPGADLWALLQSSIAPVADQTVVGIAAFLLLRFGARVSASRSSLGSMAAGGLATLVITRDAAGLHVHPGLLLLVGLIVVLFGAMVGVMAVLKRSEDA